MAFEKIVLRPGVDLQQTPLLNEASWSSSNLIRFFQGLLQKLGGWMHINSTPFQGICRGILAWADLSSNTYIAIGTEQRLEIFTSGNLYDVTPIRKTDNITPNYSTAMGSNVVTVRDSSNGASATDGVLILNPISVGGLIIQGSYEIQTIVDANNFTINAASNAASTVNNGGAAAEYTTINTSSTVKVTLNNNGLSSGGVYTVYVQTTVGGITLTVGSYLVGTVIDANNFNITASGPASSSTTGFENGGNSQIQYLLPAGLPSAAPAIGYGDGGYGLGPYGQGSTSGTPAALRQWTMGAFGQDLVAAPTGGSIYLWNPSLGLFENPATLMSANAPAVVEGLFIAMPEQQIVTFGATDPATGNPDPMLIRWCDVADFTDWTATAANQAGSFRLPRGSRIVGGIQGPQYGLLWTDLGLWAMSYIQPPLVYGFNEISEGCGLVSMRAMCVLGINIFWMSYNGFFVYSGGAISPVPCDVWDILFKNINWPQQDKITMGANSHFNEFFVFYPSASGTGENDSYIKATVSPNGVLWDYGTMIRTAWYDQSIFTSNDPIGTDTSGLIQQHETSNDADGSPLMAFAESGWFKLNDGEFYIFIERMIPDFVFTGGATIQISVLTADYPTDTPRVQNFTVTQATEYIIIRSRSRLARIQIASTADLGTFWRLGEMLYQATPAGRR